MCGGRGVGALALFFRVCLCVVEMLRILKFVSLISLVFLQAGECTEVAECRKRMRTRSFMPRSCTCRVVVVCVCGGGGADVFFFGYLCASYLDACTTAAAVVPVLGRNTSRTECMRGTRFFIVYVGCTIFTTLPSRRAMNLLTVFVQTDTRYTISVFFFWNVLSEQR